MKQSRKPLPFGITHTRTIRIVDLIFIKLLSGQLGSDLDNLPLNITKRLGIDSLLQTQIYQITSKLPSTLIRWYARSCINSLKLLQFEMLGFVLHQIMTVFIVHASRFQRLICRSIVSVILIWHGQLKRPESGHLYTETIDCPSSAGHCFTSFHIPKSVAFDLWPGTL